MGAQEAESGHQGKGEALRERPSLALSQLGIQDSIRRGSSAG